MTGARPQQLVLAPIVPLVAGAIAAAVAWDRVWTLLIGALLLVDLAGVALVIASGRSDDRRWHGAALIVQLDLFAAALLLVAYAAGGRSPLVGVALAIVFCLAAVPGHVFRRQLSRELRAPTTWFGRAVTITPALAFGGALTGYAVGRGLARFPAAVMVILTLVAFYLVLAVHSSWQRVEDAD